MSRRVKPKCKCPPKSRPQGRLQVKRPEDCRLLINIIKELSEEAGKSDISELTRRSPTAHTHSTEAPSASQKRHRHGRSTQRHDTRACVPMTPSMHTRLRIRGEHCKYDYDSPTSTQKATNARDYTCPDMDPAEAKRKKSVHYNLGQFPCPVIMPKPLYVVRHSCSDKSILRVPSPVASGEVIYPRPASLTPSEHRPPLPSNRDFSMHRPHSGLYINVTDDFVPETEGGVSKSSRGRRRQKGHRARRMSYKRQAQRRKLEREKHKRRDGSAGGASRVSDGKPQHERSTQKRLGDDDSTCGADQIPSPLHNLFGGLYCLLAPLHCAPDGTWRQASTLLHLLAGYTKLDGKHELFSLLFQPLFVSAMLQTVRSYPYHIVKMPKNLKRGTLQTHSMTVLPCPRGKQAYIHFGILTSSYNLNDTKYGARSRGQQALTMSIMAYCLAFHYHPKQWSMQLLDTVLDCGDQWYIQCLDKVHDHSMVQGICEVLPFGKKQTLILNSKKMQIILSEPDVVGYTMSQDPKVYNLCRGLKMFFKCNRAGIFLSRILKVVIWKDTVCYYIFDPAGRDANAYANSKEGKAALINVQDLNGVTEVLLARSVIEDQKYVLAALKVLRMADEDSQEDFGTDHEMTPAEKAMAEYRILSETCAIVNANMHLGDACFEDAKFRQALPIAVVAISYAKISPPNTWNTKTLDKILRLGTKLYLDCSQPNVLIDLTIDNIPTEISVGPYKCEIIIYRERVKGQLFTNKECILNIKSGLEELFKKEYNSGIIQFNNYTLAVWRQKEMYYIFDPYPCSSEGMKALKGTACVLMNLNPAAAAEMFIRSWDYLPATTQFCIHAFKVLKLKKQEFKAEILCPETASEEELARVGRRRPRRRSGAPCPCRGDGLSGPTHPGAPPMGQMDSGEPPEDEEHLGDITSLVDSILEDYVPQIPLRYKNAEPEPVVPRIANLDSPTVSVTQIVPPVAAPRDKTGEPPEPDPDPEPEPPPPPPPVEKGEGAEEVEEEEEEVEEEEEKVEKVEEELKVEELAPPPPSPEPEPELAPVQMAEDESQTMRQNVHRRVLLTADARHRYRLRELRKRASPPLEENELSLPPSQEILQPTNFKQNPDGTQIISGHKAIDDERAQDVLPFVSIMAIVTSYKYRISTWSAGIVDFVVDTARKLYENKEKKFQFAPVHVIPKIAIGQQEYQATVEVGGEGATWHLEKSLARFLQRRDRGMVTTAHYSCAVFRKNGLYYLMDGSPCNAVGLRDCGKKGNAVLLRFESLHALVHRFMYNKDGDREHQQFIISRIVVRRLVRPPRERLPDSTADAPGDHDRPEYLPEAPPRPPAEEPKPLIGYHYMDGLCRIEGTESLKNRAIAPGIKECHFVCLVAMVTLAMHPLSTWNHRSVDAVLEKGLEIYEKACNLSLCERRVIRHVLIEDMFFNINIKKVIVINENDHRTIEQYLRAVLQRLRYVIIRYPHCSMVIYQDGGYYHLFDPYPPPRNEEPEDPEASIKSAEAVASWTLYRTFDALINRLNITIPSDAVNEPAFYTYELTSVKKAPKRATFNYKLSPIFKPQVNPNKPLRRRRRVLPVVDEKINWVYIKKIPWARGSPFNDLGYERNTSKTLWRDWDIEFPGDLYSLWGTNHPMSTQFAEENRGKQILAINTVAIAMTKYYELSEWTSNVLDAVVTYGDQYHTQSVTTSSENYEIGVEDLSSSFRMYPYAFSVSFEKVIFGTTYSIHKDRINLSRGLVYFFESNRFGILVCQSKNLAFGAMGNSYFMFDCQSYGSPVFAPQQGSSYILKCESLNRLIYCMTVTLNIRRHGVQFDIYSVKVELSDL